MLRFEEPISELTRIEYRPREAFIWIFGDCVQLRNGYLTFISLNGQSAETKLQRPVAASALLGPPVANPYIRTLAKRSQRDKLEHTAEIHR